MSDLQTIWRRLVELEARMRLKQFSTLQAALEAMHPVGSIYISTVSTNPATLFGFGTWAAFGAGRVLVGIDAGQTEFDTVEETGGAKTHTLTTSELPNNYYGSATFAAAAGASATVVQTPAQGGGAAHNNLQPYIVCYFWKRTA